MRQNTEKSHFFYMILTTLRKTVGGGAGCLVENHLVFKILFSFIRVYRNTWLGN